MFSITSYIVTMPSCVQDNILQALSKRGPNLEEIKVAMSGRLCDLDSTLPNTIINYILPQHNGEKEGTL